MTSSPSTPRLRKTAALLLLIVACVAVTDRRSLTVAAGELAQWLGLACLIVATLWRIWTSVFIAGFKDISLVRTGPYSACRHPLYLGSLLAMLGIGLSTRCVTLAVLVMATSAALHGRAMREEEARLLAMHGDAYARYRDDVPALWPDFSRYTVPESVEVRPQVLWKAFLDAGSVLGTYLLVVLADWLQIHGITPSLMRLP